MILFPSQLNSFKLINFANLLLAQSGNNELKKENNLSFNTL